MIVWQWNCIEISILFYGIVIRFFLIHCCAFTLLYDSISICASSPMQHSFRSSHTHTHSFVCVCHLLFGGKKPFRSLCCMLVILKLLTTSIMIYTLNYWSLWHFVDCRLLFVSCWNNFFCAALCQAFLHELNGHFVCTPLFDSLILFSYAKQSLPIVAALFFCALLWRIVFIWISDEVFGAKLNRLFKWLMFLCSFFLLLFACLCTANLSSDSNEKKKSNRCFFLLVVHSTILRTLCDNSGNKRSDEQCNQFLQSDPVVRYN